MTTSEDLARLGPSLKGIGLESWYDTRIRIGVRHSYRSLTSTLAIEIEETQSEPRTLCYADPS